MKHVFFWLSVVVVIIINTIIATIKFTIIITLHIQHTVLFPNGQWQVCEQVIGRDIQFSLGSVSKFKLLPFLPAILFNKVKIIGLNLKQLTFALFHYHLPLATE